MEEIRQDLERYGVRTEARGYVCPGCEQTYPSIYWFQHSLVDDRVVCERCAAESHNPGNYENLVEITTPEETRRHDQTTAVGVLLSLPLAIYATPHGAEGMNRLIEEHAPFLAFLTGPLEWLARWSAELTGHLIASVIVLTPVILLWRWLGPKDESETRRRPTLR